MTALLWAAPARADEPQAPIHANAAFQRLDEALAKHPKMKVPNRTEELARLILCQANISGNEAAIREAFSALARAKIDRIRAAKAVPELTRLLVDWQRTRMGLPPLATDEPVQEFAAY
ncbi:hypothetical protein [Haloferula sargassicola]